MAVIKMICDIYEEKSCYQTPGREGNISTVSGEKQSRENERSKERYRHRQQRTIPAAKKWPLSARTFPGQVVNCPPSRADERMMMSSKRTSSIFIGRCKDSPTSSIRLMHLLCANLLAFCPWEAWTCIIRFGREIRASPFCCSHHLHKIFFQSPAPACL